MAAGKELGMLLNTIADGYLETPVSLNNYLP